VTKSLFDAFHRIVGYAAFDGSHVSLDRDHRGEMTLNIAPDWVDGVGLALLVNLARELELSIAITEKGIRLDEQTADTVRGVQAVKDTLAADRDGDDDDD
jgi:hypothetical protein